ncbi:MAG TPA: hypothetical protein VKU60_14355 [Chloroflexota bacterium]|nr:hypothetical protein [Chloroflexota bacterium]
MFWDIGEVLALGLIPLAVLPIRLPLAWLGAGFNFAFALLMTAYVFGADTYTNNGSSRWANRGSSGHAAYFVVTAIAGLFIAVFVALAVLRKRDRRVRPALAVSAALNLVMGYVLVLFFDNN